jgi:hypothetical protein
MNEQATSAAIAEAREAKAERLFSALLASSPTSSMPSLWETARDGDDDTFDAHLCALVLHAYDRGYDDGFAEGEAIANEPDRNEGYE